MKAAAALRLAVFTILSLAGEYPHVYAQDQSRTKVSRTGSADSSRASRRYTQEGISVEFSLEPVTVEPGKPIELQAGRTQECSSRLPTPLEARRSAICVPSCGSISVRQADVSDAKECREKVQAFLQTSFSKRPDSRSECIFHSDSEPGTEHLGDRSAFGFGGSKLYNLIALPSPGEDWVMSCEQNRLYVSMPAVNQVAVIDMRDVEIDRQTSMRE